MLDDVLKELGLTMVRQFMNSHKPKGAYEVMNEVGASLVLKYSQSEAGIQEIVTNLKGFKKLGQYAPHVYASDIRADSAYILMQNLGNDFSSMSVMSTDNAKSYTDLVKELEQLYNVSLHTLQDEQACFLSGMLEIYRLIDDDFYKDYLGSSIEVIHKIKQHFLFSVNTQTFSCWNFRPTNVYLNNGKIKITSPLSQLNGVPIIDLAVFAGVARDVLALPGSQQGYELLYNFATTRVATLLGIRESKAIKLFHAGRILQLLKGIKSRLLEGKPVIANEYKQDILNQCRLIESI